MKIEKLAPSLATALCDFLEGGPDAVELEMASGGPIRLLESSDGLALRAFLECPEDANLDGLERLGVIVGEAEGEVRTARVPFASLAELTESPEIDYIVPSHRMFAQMDKAAERTGLDAWRERLGPAAATGQGVMIGIVDSGIDARHPAFGGRIDRIWDQTLDGPGVREGRYGLVLSGPDLERCKDVTGHGTHVAGIAAGASGPFGSGVAPEATLLPVKVTPEDAQITDAIRYIFRVAAERDMPAVVNISYSSHDNGHDGADGLSKAINDRSGPGRIVCCAAGNDGQRRIHGHVGIPADGQSQMSLTTPTSTWLACWYGDDDQVSVQVVSPSGEQTDWKRVSDWASPQWDDLADGRVRVSHSSGSGPGTDNVAIHVVPKTLGRNGPADAWQLNWRNEGPDAMRVDAWVVDTRTFDGPADHVEAMASFVVGSAESSDVIGTPGCANAAITVASYTTRNRWLSLDKLPRGRAFGMNDISPFSSGGPRRDGGCKPDLTAPGAMIVSCRSRDALPPPWSVMSPDYMVQGGTSMACPFVAGVVALILEDKRWLRSDEVKDLLVSACSMNDRPAGYPGPEWDPKWGYGLIDVAKALGD